MADVGLTLWGPTKFCAIFSEEYIAPQLDEVLDDPGEESCKCWYGCNDVPSDHAWKIEMMRKLKHLLMRWCVIYKSVQIWKIVCHILSWHWFSPWLIKHINLKIHCKETCFVLKFLWNQRFQWRYLCRFGIIHWRYGTTVLENENFTLEEIFRENKWIVHFSVKLSRYLTWTIPLHFLVMI